MEMKTILYGFMAIAMITIFCTLIPSIGSTVEMNNKYTEKIQSVNVFFNDGTDAQNFKVAIYNYDGKKLGETLEGEILEDSWCVANFKHPLIVKNTEKYYFLVSADGDFSVQGNSETGYIEEEIEYGKFPTSITPSGSSKLSIYANYM